MPPRRKAAALKNGTDGPPTKIAKSSDPAEDKIGKIDQKNKAGGDDSDSDDVSLIWQYESGKKCLPFKDKEIEVINNGLKSKESRVKLQQPRVGAVTIDFEKMVKKTETNGWEVRIRYASGNVDGGHFVWMWTDSQGEDNAFDPHDAIALEKAFNSKSKISLSDNWKDWTIDLKGMEMKKKTLKQKLSRVAIEKCNIFPKASDSSPVKADKPATKSKAGTSKKAAEVSEEPVVKSVRVTESGKAPVDPECLAKVDTAHVYCEGDEVWDAMLNQTNIQFNNNKYYIVQLLEDNNKKAYSVWTRWGRVGKTGQNSLQECGANLDKAKDCFKKKFTDKTKNQWDNRDSFEKVPGKYDLLKMDYSVDDKKDSVKEKEPKKPKTIPESKLEAKVRELVELICNIRAMEETVMEMEYDAKKAPLGKLTADQVKAGYAALKVIDEQIQKNIRGPRLLQACNDFYTRIPHNFGMKQPPLITTTDEIKKKITLLEALGDIQIALKIMNEVSDVVQNPVDKHYHSLRCDLKPIEKSNSDFKLINDYLQKTHAQTHNMYRLDLLEVFDCKKDHLEFKENIGNRMLLWHGSRLTNWAGILGQGLRIAPPEAPVTGYMFGKGVYFADMSSKSANYCFTTRTNNVGLLLLCEVALGEINKLVNSDYNADKLPPGKHSVLGAGRVVPDMSTHVKLPDGTLVPVGKAVDSSVSNSHGYTLNYNEYIVYDTKQIRMRYLLKVKFVYKK